MQSSIIIVSCFPSTSVSLLDCESQDQNSNQSSSKIGCNSESVKAYNMSISQHIASIRSRASHQQRISDSDNKSHNDELNSENLSRLSVVSLSEDDDLRFGQSGARQSISTGEHPDVTKSMAAVAPVVYPSLSLIESIQDIEMNIDSDHCQINLLAKLERKWIELSNNLNTTLAHLQECSYQVTESSTACLGSLNELVETTCDEIDAELKAFYHLMTKCDELTTKLSMATSFREEIRTLRKTVETLEQLSRTKPPPIL